MNEFDAAQFDALGPWITGFVFGGTQYGGQYRADTDSRVLRFISRFRERLAASNRGRDQPLRILECGCLEGGHTSVLAQAFPEAESLRWMCAKQVWRRQSSFSRPRGLETFDSPKRILMSRLQLLHSNTMRSSASDYFIICDNQQSLSHEPPSRLVFVAFHHHLRRTGSGRRRRRLSRSPFRRSCGAPAGRSGPTIFSADDWFLGRYAVGGRI